MNPAILAIALALNSPAGGPVPSESAFIVPLNAPTPPLAVEWGRQTQEQLRRSATFAELQSLARQVLMEDRSSESAESTDSASPFSNDVFVGQKVLSVFRAPGAIGGVLRVTSADSYRSAHPQWTVLLDFDALGRAEGRQPRFGGIRCRPDGRTCLVETYTDYTRRTVRELDLASGRFVQGGFSLEGALSRLQWKDSDTLFVKPLSDLAGTVDRQGLAIREWRRGTDLSEAPIVYARPSAQTTGYVGLEPVRDVSGEAAFFLITDQLSASLDPDELGQIYSILTHDGQIIRVPSAIAGNLKLAVGIAGDDLYFMDRQNKYYVTSVTSLLRGEPGTVREIWEPGTGQLAFGHALTEAGLVITYSDRGVYGLRRVRPTSQGVASDAINAPENGTIRLFRSQPVSSTRIYFTYQNLLVPETIYALDVSSGAVERVRSPRAAFDASPYITERYNATSADGVQVPYLVVHRRDLAFDGDAPTIMTGYPNAPEESPLYQAIQARLWIARGGVFVHVPRVRGAGLTGRDRSRGYEDFVAVAQDLIRRRITRPRRLGMTGFSMGGLLAGVMYTRYNNLFHAFAIENPVLDIYRTTTSPDYPGVSAQDFRFGDRSDPELVDYLRNISPLQALRAMPGSAPPFIATSNSDSDVPPVAARLFARRLSELGMPFYYWETSTPGVDHGHCGTTSECVLYEALKYSYFDRQLRDPSARTGASRAHPPR